MSRGAKRRPSGIGILILTAVVSVLFLPSAALYPAEEILMETPSIQYEGPDRFILKTVLSNTTDDPREVVYRAQLHFFDRVSPEGDVPLSILRKDGTIILRAHERRFVEVSFLSYEPPKNTAFRVEPLIRLRRQRVWKY